MAALLAYATPLTRASRTPLCWTPLVALSAIQAGLALCHAPHLLHRPQSMTSSAQCHVACRLSVRDHDPRRLRTRSRGTYGCVARALCSVTPLIAELGASVLTLLWYRWGGTTRDDESRGSGLDRVCEEAARRVELLAGQAPAVTRLAHRRGAVQKERCPARSGRCRRWPRAIRRSQRSRTSGLAWTRRDSTKPMWPRRSCGRLESTKRVELAEELRTLTPRPAATVAVRSAAVGCTRAGAARRPRRPPRARRSGRPS